MTDKIAVVTICQDEMQILPYTLPQSLKHADLVVVINGGTKLSTDGTTEYLDKLASANSALIVKHGIFGDHTQENNWDRVQRNEYIDILEDLNWDGWMFLVDCDETYTDEDWLKIKDAVKQANINNQIMIRFPYVNFFYDLDHVVQDHNFSTPAHHLSIFEEGCRYLDNSTLLRDITGRCYTHYPHEQIMSRDDIQLYHYSHIRTYEEEKARTWRYLKRGDKGPEVASQIPDDINQWQWTDPRIEELKDINRVKPFTGGHPPHMEEYVNKFHENREARKLP